MRTGLGCVLAGVGMLVVLTGIGGALWALVGLYAGAINDPLGQPEGTEAHVEHAMLIWVGVGAVGIVPLAIGSALLKAKAAAKLRKALSGRG